MGRLLDALPRTGGSGKAHRENARGAETSRRVRVHVAGLSQEDPTFQRAIQTVDPHESPFRREAKQVPGKCAHNFHFQTFGSKYPQSGVDSPDWRLPTLPTNPSYSYTVSFWGVKYILVQRCFPVFLIFTKLVLQPLYYVQSGKAVRGLGDPHTDVYKRQVYLCFLHLFV